LTFSGNVLQLGKRIYQWALRLLFQSAMRKPIATDFGATAMILGVNHTILLIKIVKKKFLLNDLDQLIKYF
jgi:hypothetical protein